MASPNTLRSCLFSNDQYATSGILEFPKASHGGETSVWAGEVITRNEKRGIGQRGYCFALDLGRRTSDFRLCLTCQAGCEKGGDGLLDNVHREGLVDAIIGTQRNGFLMTQRIS